MNLGVVLERDPWRMLRVRRINLRRCCSTCGVINVPTPRKDFDIKEDGSRSLASFLFFSMGEARQWAGPPPRGSDDP
jgi:hypothetical protein